MSIFLRRCFTYLLCRRPFGAGKRLPAAMLLFAALIVLVACTREEAPSPIVMTPATPTETPTATPSPSPMPSPTPDATATTVTESPVEGQTVGDVRASSTISSATSSIVDADGNCLIETDLDLVGYPDLQEAMGCATASASYEDVAINEFGEGPEFNRFMFWFSTDQMIYVLLPNQTWEAFPDTWSETEPEILCNPFDEEATSPPLPRRGFGKLWCSVDELQEVMGTIPREERLCQHAVTQQFENGQLLACFEDATIRYVRILSDGSWDTLFVQ